MYILPRIKFTVGGKKMKKKKKMQRKGRKLLGKVKPVNYFFLKKELSVKLTNFKRQNLNGRATCSKSTMKAQE